MQITAEAEPSSTYIAHRIIDYLERHDKSADAQVLNETMTRMRTIVVRDLLQPRDSRQGKESNTLYSGPCARKSHLTYHGATREPLRARTLLKFMLGDLVEACTLAMARLAGCHITDSQIDLSITGHDGKPVPVHPDGFYQAPDGQMFNIEIKSCDSRTFDYWQTNNGPDDTWGYLSQASVECQAWREYGKDVNGTLFLAVSTGSRIGSIAEYYAPYQPELVEAWHNRRDEALSGLPPIPFSSEPEIVFRRGKDLDPATDFAHGEPIPRMDKNGKVIGFDLPTGRQIVPLQCSYCDFRSTQCWKSAEMDLHGNKPVWIVPASAAPGASLDVPPTADQEEGAGQLAPSLHH